MNRFYAGKQRSGKTKGAVIWMLERLRTTKRPLVTNAALKLQPWVDGKGVARPGLLEVLRKRYGTTFDAERRIYLLKDDEVRRFYGVRPLIPEQEWQEREILKVPEVGDGRWHFDASRFPACDYVIDEVHDYFPRQGLPSYKERPFTGEMLGYSTQSARGGDENVYISQLPNNCNLQLRGLCQACHWFTNHVHANVGPFRRADKITCDVFSNTPPGQGEQRMKRETMHYDRFEIESCYNTAEGGGVVGNSAADIGQRAKGMPQWLMWVFIVLTGFAFLLFAMGLKKGAEVALGVGWGKKMKGEVGVTNALFSQAQTDALKRMLVEARIQQLTPGLVRSTNVVKVLRQEDKDLPRCIGYGQMGKVAVLTLEGGGNVWGERLERAGRRLLLDGEVYLYAPLKSQEKGKL